MGDGRPEEWVACFFFFSIFKWGAFEFDQLQKAGLFSQGPTATGLLRVEKSLGLAHHNGSNLPSSDLNESRNLLRVPLKFVGFKFGLEMHQDKNAS